MPLLSPFPCQLTLLDMFSLGNRGTPEKCPTSCPPPLDAYHQTILSESVRPHLIVPWLLFENPPSAVNRPMPLKYHHQATPSAAPVYKCHSYPEQAHYHRNHRQTHLIDVMVSVRLIVQ